MQQVTPCMSFPLPARVIKPGLLESCKYPISNLTAEAAAAQSDRKNSPSGDLQAFCRGNPGSAPSFQRGRGGAGVRAGVRGARPGSRRSAEPPLCEGLCARTPCFDSNVTNDLVALTVPSAWHGDAGEEK